MEKRVLLAVFLSFLVLVAYQRFLAPPPLEVPVPAAPSRRQTSPPPPTLPATPIAPVELATGAEAPGESRDVVIESAELRVVLSTRGATVRSWRLKRYLGSDGRPIELVPSSVPDTEPAPYSIAVADAQITARLRRAAFRPNVERLEIGSGPNVVTFEHQSADGLTARKRFDFSADGPYVVRVSAAVEFQGRPLEPVVQWGPGLGDEGSTASRYLQPPAGIVHQNGAVDRLRGDELDGRPTLKGGVRFAGIDDHYFAAIALPAGSEAVVRLLGISLCWE